MMRAADRRPRLVEMASVDLTAHEFRGLFNAMGVHLLDYLQFEDVVRHCEAVGRWEFLFVAAPLRIVGGTGSPVNPTAIF
jgi:kynurenine formamidase